MVQVGLDVNQDHTSKITKAKRAGSLTECLPSKPQVLSSTPIISLTTKTTTKLFILKLLLHFISQYFTQLYTYSRKFSVKNYEEKVEANKI
jgi:hypothetical protein